jgi:hypothetical protein
MGFQSTSPHRSPTTYANIDLELESEKLQDDPGWNLESQVTGPGFLSLASKFLSQSIANQTQHISIPVNKVVLI